MTAARDDDANHRPYGAYGLAMMSPGAAHTGYAGEIHEFAFDGYMLGNRIYLPWLRYFISPDPASPFDIGGLNRYAYCLGDPINRIDPSGNASLGWLGKLLGNLLGGMGHAAHTVAQATPTTALAVVSRAAETVSVAVGIGAVAAAALDDTQTAGMLGWIAAGGGIAGLGMNIVGSSLGKTATSHRRLIGDLSDRPRGRASQTTRVPPFEGEGPALEYTSVTRRSKDGTREVTIHRGLAAMLHRIPERTTTGMVTSHPLVVPHWYEMLNITGGINYAVDSEISGRKTFDLISDVIMRKQDNMPVILVSGIHGDAKGWNWTGKGTPANTAPMLFAWDSAKAKHDFQEHPRGLFVVNAGELKRGHYEKLLRQPAHIVHAYCFSAADRTLMKTLHVKHMPIYAP